MDNVTHTLVGIALAQAGLKRKTRFALLGLIIASNLPDADVVSAASGGIAYLKYHRGITHSLIGLTALAAILAFFLYFCARRIRPGKGSPPLSLKWLFLACWAGTACHVLMDFTNAYGIRPFLPFSSRWYALDIMPIIGLWLLLFLALGLGLPLILGLVTEEVGAKKGAAHAARNGAIFSLCAMAALWGLRGFSHQRALGLLSAHTYGGENLVRLGAFPEFLNPFDWTGVAETDDEYFVLETSALADNVNVEDAEVFRKPAPSPALAAAQKTSGARIFLSFARFPFAAIYSEEEGSQVYIRDLRFASSGSHNWNFVLEVKLGQSMQVLDQTFSFRMRKPEY
ncbi:MAG: metal-dependent hydrolase [Acidobacteriota bacterium]|nr:metal-dependent hydrolase [Acidobacteriota bacterium]